jgi:hypothetical protein
MLEGGNLVVFLIVVGARLAVPLFIPRYPIPAGLAALVIDGVDQTIFQRFTSLNLAGYQSYDKALDTYYLSIEYLSTLRNWANLAAFGMSRLLFYVRLVGSLLFEVFQLRALLLLFPNTFEYFFLFYEVVRLRWDPRRLSQAMVIGAAFAIWVVIKIPQEYWIHVAQLDVTDTLKTRVFGAPLETPWGEIIGQHIPSVIALAAGLLLLVLVARWLIVTLLPPADWRFSFDVDAHGRDISRTEAEAERRDDARVLFTAGLTEKIALVSILTIIFALILPNARTGAPQIAAGVATVILANTVITEWLVRSGVRWRSSVTEFAVMAVVNVALVALFSALLPWINASIDAPATLFGILLLTLLVTLYDRYRPYHQVRVAREVALHDR